MAAVRRLEAGNSDPIFPRKKKAKENGARDTEESPLCDGDIASRGIDVEVKVISVALATL